MYEDEEEIPNEKEELIRAIKGAMYYLDIMLNNKKFELTDYDEDNLGGMLVFFDEYVKKAV